MEKNFNMAKVHFIPDMSKQSILFPSRIDENIPLNAPVRIIDQVLDQIDISRILSLYHVSGRSSFPPRMMLKVIIYAYMNNIYSCRRIEDILHRDLHFIWLSGSLRPDFATINRFRNRVKDEISAIFTQLVLLLSERGFVSLDVEYVDGTKIESKANKYTFVWRKNVDRNIERLRHQLGILLSQVDDVIAQDNTVKEESIAISVEMVQDITTRLNDSIRQSPSPTTKEERASIRAKKRQLKEIEQKAAALADYEEKKALLGNRNSFSKTDPDATFMRMKEDAMNNGQTKPGYNLQIGTENQFILDFALFPNPTDTLTYIPFMESFAERYGKLPSIEVADSGYGSEENYRYMEEHSVEAFVKYNMFHKEQRMHYTLSPFHQDSLYYNRESDYYVCPMGQHLERIGTKRSRTDSGYITESAQYQARNCKDCPLRSSCFKGKGNRIIEVNHMLKEYKRKASERLTSQEGIRHRGRRCIEPEAVFGQIKYNYNYKRFRHFGQDKVTMDFAFFAIAFNLKKMCTKLNKVG